ncbi:hypothetical protein K1719_009549 [Acacia pycnantha]|nr:hypothetical protein K1719_009549 [Acacia pycnantha]
MVSAIEGLDQLNEESESISETVTVLGEASHSDPYWDCPRPSSSSPLVHKVGGTTPLDSLSADGKQVRQQT